MKKLFIVFFYLLISLSCFSQNKTLDSLKHKIVNLEDISKKSFQINDSLIKANSKLNEEIDYNEKLLDRFDTLNNIVFATMGVLFASFGLIGYFFIYKPSREDLKEAQLLIKEIRGDLSKLFSDHLKKHTKDLIDEILKHIEDDTPEASNKILQLQLYQYEKFDDSQIKRIIELIKSKNKHSQILLSIISYSDNIHTEVFFSKAIKNTSYEWNNMALVYFAKYDKTEYIDEIAKYIIQTNLNNAYHTIKPFSRSFLKKLFDNDVLVNGISNESISYFIQTNFIHTSLPGSLELQDTKLYKKYLKIPKIK